MSLVGDFDVVEGGRKKAGAAVSRRVLKLLVILVLTLLTFDLNFSKISSNLFLINVSPKMFRASQF